MVQIVNRNIDDAVLAALRKRPAAAGTSTGEPAHYALTNAVGLDRPAALRRVNEIRRQIGRLEGDAIIDDLRRDRRRDTSST
jgi:plasmid stability protein